MKKTNKLILGGLTAVAAVAAPIATVVSCGSSVNGIKRYDTVNDGKLVIKTGWSANGKQTKALTAVVNEYNKSIKAKPVAGAMPVEIVHSEGGYGKMAPTLSTQIAAHKTKGMPNMLIEYADSVGIINRYKFALDLNKTKTPFNKSLIDAHFMEVNSKIGGADKTGTYMTPLGKSTEMLAINKPLIKMVLKAIKANGGTVTGTILSGILADTALDGDANAQATVWGTPTAAELPKTVSDNILSSYKDLFAFANKVAKAYKLSPQGDKFIVGHDSGTNLAYSLGFAKNDFDYNKFLFSKSSTGKGYVNYDLFKDGSQQNKDFKGIISELRDVVSTGGLKIAGGGEYTSSLFSQHHTMFSIGSTAGYSHLSASSSVKTILLKDGKTQDLLNSPINVKLDGGTLKGNSYKTYWNNIATKDGGHHEIVLEQAIIDELKKIVTGTTQFTIFDSSKKIDAFDKASNIKLLHTNSTGGFKYIVESSKLTTASPTSTLQEDEMQVAPGIAKYTSTQKGTMAFSQGPSFVGVHANAAEDNATAIFLNWFYNSKTMIDGAIFGKSYIKGQMTAVQGFEKASGYITPVAGFQKHAAPHDKGAKIAFESYAKNIQTGGHIFVAPVDDFSSSLRQLLASQIKSIFTTAHTGQTASASAIYGKILGIAKTNKIV